MSSRFRRSIRICRGLHLNLSKSGVSASIGIRGATVNVSGYGVQETVGLPGTGLSYIAALADESERPADR